LEFDIGFLPDVYFLIRADARASDRDGRARAQSVFPAMAERGTASAATLFATADWFVMAFGMPEAKLSRRAPDGSAENMGNLTFWHLVCQT
jgi:hypothetical protein